VVVSGNACQKKSKHKQLVHCWLNRPQGSEKDG
jgi:hypothetical protein